jgi:hypothetical protein
MLQSQLEDIAENIVDRLFPVRNGKKVERLAFDWDNDEGGNIGITPDVVREIVIDAILNGLGVTSK